MTHQEALSILDPALLNFRAVGKEEGTCDVFQAVFFVIERHVYATADDIPGLRSRFPQLASLYSVQPNWALLESLVARAIDLAFTAWIDGVPAGANNSSLDTLVLTSCSR